MRSVSRSGPRRKHARRPSADAGAALRAEIDQVRALSRQVAVGGLRLQAGGGACMFVRAHFGAVGNAVGERAGREPSGYGHCASCASWTSPARSMYSPPLRDFGPVFSAACKKMSATVCRSWQVHS
jgi:hypothetical protein